MRAADSKLAVRATWLATRLAGAISPRLAGPPAARLWFTPWRLPVSERAKERQRGWLEGTEPVSFVHEGRRVAGRAAGSGPVVVLVHGWGERGASLGAFVAPLVESGHRAVLLDLPGHGDSAGGQTDGLKLAAAIRSVCDSLGDVHAVIGHSMGATSTLFAASEGLSPRALVLIAPSPRLDHALDRFAQLFALPPKAKASLKSMMERRYGSDVWERLAGQVLARNVHIPTLIVHDREDPQVALADAEALHESWPESRLMTTEGLGHGRILRDPKVIEEVMSFVAKARLRAAAEA